MNRARIGALGAALVLSPALLLASGCSFVDGVKEGVSEAKNTVEVCTATIALFNQHMTAVSTAATVYNTKPGDAAARQAFETTTKTEMAALHTGLQEQAGKATNAEVKLAIEKLDEQVNLVAQKPAAMATNGTQVQARVDDLNKACRATAPSEKPAE